MVNKGLGLGILVMALVLVFGIGFVSCEPNNQKGRGGCENNCESKWENGVGGYAGCSDTSCSVYIANKNKVSSSSCNCP
jgi:hypothetical protein